MRKRLFVLLAVLLFVMVFSQNLFASSNSQLNRVVVTFSPLVVKNINCTSQLFNVFVNLSKNKTELSKTISENYCGIQVCISSSKSPEELFNIINPLLEKSFKASENLFNSRIKFEIKPIDRLYQFFIKNDSSAFKAQPVSIRFFDYSGKELENFYSDHFKDNETSSDEAIDEGEAESAKNEKESNNIIDRFCKLYENCYATNAERPNVQAVSKPILAKLVFWNNLNPDSFISASLIKNKLIFDGETNQKNSGIELLNTGKGLVLVVLSEVEKNSLYAQHLLMNKRIEAAVSGIGPKEWEAWNSKLLEVMRNDRRDFKRLCLTPGINIGVERALIRFHKNLILRNQILSVKQKSSQLRQSIIFICLLIHSRLFMLVMKKSSKMEPMLQSVLKDIVP